MSIGWRRRATSVQSTWFLLVTAFSRDAAAANDTNGTYEYSVAREKVKDLLLGKEVRVTFGATEDPYVYPDSGSAEWGYAGVLVEFLNHLQGDVGFNVVIKDVSDDSVAVVGTNRNTACVRDVQLNRTDLCVGNAWVTPQRLSYAKALPNLWQESLYLGVSLTQDNSFQRALLQAFSPFDPLLWLAIFVTILLYSTLAWYVERYVNDRDFPDKDCFQSAMTSIYHGLFSFFWSEPSTRPLTAEGRILAVGFGFFTLIMLSSYTASLASVMVAQNNMASIKSLEEAITLRKRVCMWSSALDRAKQLYPMLPSLAEDMDSYEEGYEKVASGECNVILVDPIFHAKAQERTERDCDKVLVGDPVVDINCAWFCADWLLGPMSVILAEVMDRGELADIRRVYYPKVACQDSRARTTQGLQIQNVSGVFFIIGFFALLAGIVHLCKNCFRIGLRRSGDWRTTISRLASAASWSRSFSYDFDTKSDVDERSTRPSEADQSHPSLRNRSRISLHPADDEANTSPGLDLVRRFREEHRLRELPLEKALLVIGDTQAEAQRQILDALQNLRADKGERSTDSSGHQYNSVEREVGSKSRLGVFCMI